MKYRIVTMLSAVLLSLLVVPAINIISAPAPETVKWGGKSFLYNMDFLAGEVAGLLYPLGISTDPGQVIIGREGWFYLGDHYAQTLTVDRRPVRTSDIQAARDIRAAMQAWDGYFARKGVKLFKIMIGPNKGTIYPEYMPAWARPVHPNATDALFAEANRLRYVDLRGPLLAAKFRPDALYYRTDTHWNMLGAGVAFRALAEEVAPAAPELRWLPAGAYEVSRVLPHRGGDLAAFLRLTGRLADVDPLLHVLDLPLEITQSDFATGAVKYRGKNTMIGPPARPLLVKSAGALNDKKVLWLRDSFGSAMAPLMAATFSETMHVNWNDALKPGGTMTALMDNWKPDYVFVTVVERSSRGAAFFFYPPCDVRGVKTAPSPAPCQEKPSQLPAAS